jgi:hypothetical protein
MGFFRRDRPLHEQLAEDGGLDFGPEPGETGRAPSRLAGLMHGEVGVHGIPRARRWDVVASARAELPADEVHFTALPDGTLIVEEDVPDGSLTSLAEAIEMTLNPPYRAEAVKREDDVWAVAASRIRVREFPETEGDELELVEDGNVVIGRRLDGDLFEVQVTPL